MKTINLREYYPYYEADVFVEVSDEIAQMMHELRNEEKAYLLRVYRHQAFYSLDRGDGIANDVLLKLPSMEDVFVTQKLQEQLYKAILALPPKQAQRIYAYFFLGMNSIEIAESEGVSHVAVLHSLDKGIQKLQRFLHKWKK